MHRLMSRHSDYHAVVFVVYHSFRLGTALARTPTPCSPTHESAVSLVFTCTAAAQVDVAVPICPASGALRVQFLVLLRAIMARTRRANTLYHNAGAP